MHSKKQFLILSFIACCLLCSCVNEDTPLPCNGSDTNGHIYLSFAVKSGLPTILPVSRSLPGSVTDGDVQTGEKEGVTLENKVSNLWVFLYTQGKDDVSSTLKYKFFFSFDGNGTQYKDASGSLLGPVDLDGTYHTSPKIVEPGTYCMVAVANTRTTFPASTTYPMSDNTTKDLSNQEWDIISDLMIPGKFGIDNLAAFKQSTNALPGVNVGENVPYNDKLLTANGILAYFLDEHFTVREVYNTPQTALVQPMGLKRWLSKVHVTITNTDAAGNIYPDAAGYKLKSALVMNYYQLNKFFEWDVHDKSNVLGHNSGDLFAFSAFDKDKFPLLDRLHTTGFVADGKEAEAELFNFYLGGYNYGLPQATDQNHRFVRLVFTGKTGQDFLYDLPLYNQDNAQRPDYVSPEDFNKYTLLRNTVYELRIRFKGAVLELIDVTYGVKEYTPKVVDLPPFG